MGGVKTGGLAGRSRTRASAQNRPGTTDQWYGGW